MRITILIAVLLFPFLLWGQKKYPYEKHLKVIHDTLVYKHLVDENPNKELVEIKDFVPGVVLDLRYATMNNFTGEQIYPIAKAFVRLPVAKSLRIVQEALNKRGLGLKIYDAYRPYSATIKFYEVFHDTAYEASPWLGSRHNRGSAVDVSLVDLYTGEELQMPTGFDNFSKKAHSGYMDLPKNVLKNREILIATMQQHGFKGYPSEWWHYDFMGWAGFEIMDLSFEQLEKFEKNKE